MTLAGPFARLAANHLPALIAGDWRTAGPFRLNHALTSVELTSSVLVVNARRLLSAIRERGGAPTTSHGRFAPPFVLEAIRFLWWGSSGEWEPRSWETAEPGSEEAVRPLELTRAALTAAGLLARSPGLLTVTPFGEHCLEPAHGGQLFATLFEAYFREVDHPAIDGEPAIPDAWRYVPYALGVIGEESGRWRTTEELACVLLPRRVAEAENARLAQLRSRLAALVPTVQDLFLMRFLNPLEDFALIESRPAEHRILPEWRRGPLYERVVRFEFPPS